MTKEERKAYRRAYYLANRERQIVSASEWNRTHKDRIAARKASWTDEQREAERRRQRECKRKLRSTEAGRARSREIQHRFYRNHRAERLAYAAEYREKNKDILAAKEKARRQAKIEQERESDKRYHANVLKRCENDAAFYARKRAMQRKRHARRKVLEGGMYMPRFNQRVPDWATYGQLIDSRSAFLAENMTTEQRAYARELAIERRAK